MADLAALFTRRRESRSRGQLILVTALALAAIFLGLAVIVNSAIFTENLATRSENVESTEALEYRHSVTQYMGGVIGFANENNHSSHQTIRDNVSYATQDAEEYASIQQAEDGARLSLEFLSDTEGARIFQNDGSTFENNESTTGTWILASDVDRTRAFELDISNPGDFVINVTETPSLDEWRLEIDHSSSSDDDLTVTNENGDSDTCSFGTIESVDITGATVNDSPCPALIDTENGDPLQFAATFDDSYLIRFENGGNVQGNYSLVIDNNNVGSIRDSNYAEISGPGTSPFVEPAMYSGTFALEYETARVNYETNVTVAPGESP